MDHGMPRSCQYMQAALGLQRVTLAPLEVPRAASTAQRAAYGYSRYPANTR